MLIWHFYHVYADGSWQEPAAEHVAALDAAGYHGGMSVGLVGSKDNRSAVEDWFRQRLKVDTFYEAAAGFEQVTLRQVRDWSSGRVACVLYAHSKGAYHDTEENRQWRRLMTSHLVGRWRECVQLLGDHDVVGCQLLDAGMYAAPNPAFAGNFWWATAGYLRGLPDLPLDGDRRDAEWWIGRGDPRAYDLLGRAIHTRRRFWCSQPGKK